jgi:pyruvate kinase
MLTTTTETRNQLNNLSDPHILLTILQELRAYVDTEGQVIFSKWRSRIHREVFLGSCLNLAHYIALRQKDLCELQAALIPWGLTSLELIEARVLPTLDAVIATLQAICRIEVVHPPLLEFLEGDRLRYQHSEDLFGQVSSDRQVRIMVTLPKAAADNYELVKDLITQGVNCIRINCADDNANHWSAIIAHVRQAEAETKNSCKIFMDLAGSKSRIACVYTPGNEQRIYTGDYFLLTHQDPNVTKSAYFHVSCTLPEIVEQAQIGSKIWIDANRITATVEAITPTHLLLRIIRASPEGEKLLPNMSLNSNIYLNPLTDKDRQDLDFLATNADIIGCAFARETAEIELLQQELQAGLPESSIPAIIIKIDTPCAVRNLPELIVQVAGRQPLGIMIAREIAMEIGDQSLAEIQQEVLCICQAAHVPIIWAIPPVKSTDGILTRSEITSAVFPPTECVMLEQDAFTPKIVATLKDLRQAHNLKKTYQLVALHT